MIFNLEELKDEINKRIDKIKFDEHFNLRQKMRPYLTKELAESVLKDFDNYLGFQTHLVRREIRYRLGIFLSKRYTFVIILEIGKEDLNIVSAWKTSRKWQKAVQK